VRDLRTDLGPVRCSRSPKGGHTKGEIPPGRGTKDGVIAVLCKESHTPGPGDDNQNPQLGQLLAIPLVSELSQKRGSAGDGATCPCAFQ
jgi:hypothetical protein